MEGEGRGRRPVALSVEQNNVAPQRWRRGLRLTRGLQSCLAGHPRACAGEILMALETLRRGGHFGRTLTLPLQRPAGDAAGVAGGHRRPADAWSPLRAATSAVSRCTFWGTSTAKLAYDRPGRHARRLRACCRGRRSDAQDVEFSFSGKGDAAASGARRPARYLPAVAGSAGGQQALVQGCRPGVATAWREAGGHEPETRPHGCGSGCGPWVRAWVRLKRRKERAPALAVRPRGARAHPAGYRLSARTGSSLGSAGRWP
jgi:hypothetical protein